MSDLCVCGHKKTVHKSLSNGCRIVPCDCYVYRAQTEAADAPTPAAPPLALVEKLVAALDRIADHQFHPPDYRDCCDVDQNSGQPVSNAQCMGNAELCAAHALAEWRAWKEGGK